MSYAQSYPQMCYILPFGNEVSKWVIHGFIHRVIHNFEENGGFWWFGNEVSKWVFGGMWG